MNFEQVLKEIIGENNLYFPKNRQAALRKTIYWLYNYVFEENILLTHEELTDVIKKFVRTLHEYGLFEGLDYYDIRSLLKEQHFTDGVHFYHTKDYIKIEGSKEFFLYLSRFFLTVARETSLQDILHEYSDPKPLEVFFRTENGWKMAREDGDDYDEEDEEYPNRNINIENILAIQFLYWVPEYSSLTIGKLYAVKGFHKFNEEFKGKIDIVKTIHEDFSEVWIFEILDDRGESISIASDLNDDEMMYIESYHMDQLQSGKI